MRYANRRCRSILVADDDPAIRQIVVEVLGDEGHAVASAADGVEAIRAVDRLRPDLLFLDLSMPVMDGWAVARELRSRSARPDIVVLTAAEDAAAQAAEIGAASFVVKPFDCDELIAVVEALADRANSCEQRLEELARASQELNAIFPFERFLQAAVDRACTILDATWAACVYQPTWDACRPLNAASGGQSARVWIEAPLLHLDGERAGLIEVGRIDAFTHEDQLVLNQLAAIVAAAGEKERLYREAAREERHRLARELHDSVAQALSSASFYAEAAARHLRSSDVQSAIASVDDVRTAARGALAEMRLLLSALRPPLLAERGLAVAIRARLATVEARVGLDVEADVDDDIHLPAAAENELYGIVVEALTNVVKHAAARRVRVTLRRVGRSVRLTVADDGRGFDPRDQVGAIGLLGIRERVERLGGTLEIESAPDAGTRIVVVAPT